jgi:hypothetical protein
MVDAAHRGGHHVTKDEGKGGDGVLAGRDQGSFAGIAFGAQGACQPEGGGSQRGVHGPASIVAVVAMGKHSTAPWGQTRWPTAGTGVRTEGIFRA